MKFPSILFNYNVVFFTIRSYINYLEEEKNMNGQEAFNYLSKTGAVDYIIVASFETHRNLKALRSIFCATILLYPDLVHHAQSMSIVNSIPYY